LVIVFAQCQVGYTNSDQLILYRLNFKIDLIEMFFNRIFETGQC